MLKLQPSEGRRREFELLNIFFFYSCCQEYPVVVSDASFEANLSEILLNIFLHVISHCGIHLLLFHVPLCSAIVPFFHCSMYRIRRDMQLVVFSGRRAENSNFSIQTKKSARVKLQHRIWVGFMGFLKTNKYQRNTAYVVFLSSYFFLPVNN